MLIPELIPDLITIHVHKGTYGREFNSYSFMLWLDVLVAKLKAEASINSYKHIYLFTIMKFNKLFTRFLGDIQEI